MGSKCAQFVSVSGTLNKLQLFLSIILSGLPTLMEEPRGRTFESPRHLSVAHFDAAEPGLGTGARALHQVSTPRASVIPVSRSLSLFSFLLYSEALGSVAPKREPLTPSWEKHESFLPRPDLDLIPAAQGAALDSSGFRSGRCVSVCISDTDRLTVWGSRSFG